MQKKEVSLYSKSEEEKIKSVLINFIIDAKSKTKGNEKEFELEIRLRVKNPNIFSKQEFHKNTREKLINSEEWELKQSNMIDYLYEDKRITKNLGENEYFDSIQKNVKNYLIVPLGNLNFSLKIQLSQEILIERSENLKIEPNYLIKRTKLRETYQKKNHLWWIDLTTVKTTEKQKTSTDQEVRF